MGNHDELAAFGLPRPLPTWLSEDEVEHQRWTRSQLSEAQIDILREWPYELSTRCGETTVACAHYARKNNGAFDHVADPTADDLLRLYEVVQAAIVVFGHDHHACDVTIEGRRFLNPGSVGCHDKAEARALILESARCVPHIQMLTVPYDDTAVLLDLDERQVPARDFILRTFIRRR